MMMAVIFMMLAAFPLAISGFFVSSRRMGFYVDAISHSAVAIYSIFIFLLGSLISVQDLISVKGEWDMVLAVVAVGLAGALISFRLFEDVSSREPWMGEIFVGSLGVASLFLSWMPLRGMDFDSLFIGQLLLLKPLDIAMMVGLAGLMGMAYVKYHPHWHVFFADRHLYRHLFGNAMFPIFVFFLMTSTLIAILVQSVGIILTFAWMIFPSRWAFRVSGGSIKWTLAFCPLWIVGLGGLGISLSYWANLPAGPTCALVWLIPEWVWGFVSQGSGGMGLLSSPSPGKSGVLGSSPKNRG
jgi:ABC-type Mn2+/Zn2+ transport system permease subunit